MGIIHNILEDMDKEKIWPANFNSMLKEMDWRRRFEVQILLRCDIIQIL